MFLLSCFYLLPHVWLTDFVYMYNYLFNFSFFYFSSFLFSYFLFSFSFFYFFFCFIYLSFLFFFFFFLFHINLFLFLFPSNLFILFIYYFFVVNICCLDLPTWICLLEFVLEKRVYCIMCKNWLRIPTLAVGKLQGILSHSGIEWDGWVYFKFYTRSIRSVKKESCDMRYRKDINICNNVFPKIQKSCVCHLRFEHSVSRGSLITLYICIWSTTHRVLKSHRSMMGVIYMPL